MKAVYRVKYEKLWSDTPDDWAEGVLDVLARDGETAIEAVKRTVLRERGDGADGERVKVVRFRLRELEHVVTPDFIA